MVCRLVYKQLNPYPGGGEGGSGLGGPRGILTGKKIGINMSSCEVGGGGGDFTQQ